MQLKGFDNTMMILDTLAREQSNPISISELTKEIGERYGRGHYHTIYNKIQALEKERMIILERIGKATIPKLNLQNYFLLDLLTIIEMRKKQDFLMKYPELQLPLMSIGDYCKGLHYIESICMIEPERNKKLNRIELLILLKGGTDIDNRHDNDTEHIRTEIFEINRLTQALQNKYNIKIDSLILRPNEFQELAGTEEINPLRKMLAELIAFFSPENYWREIRKIQTKGITARILNEETIPIKISKKELIYNLARFGYKEFGYSIQQGSNICIEYIITAILQSNNTRMIEAIPIILAKNDKEINYRMLLFLCQKYSLSEKILGLIQTLNELKSTEKTKEATAALQDAGIKAEDIIDKTTITEKMKLYNVL